MTTASERPRGIWIVTIWVGLFAGILPLVLAALMYFGPTSVSELMTAQQLAISAVLGVGIIISAIGAWKGQRWGRATLIVLAAVHYGLIAHNNYKLATDANTPADQIPRIWARVARSIATIAVVGAYFTLNRNARRFFSVRQLE
jgi:hypothetical protein